MTCRCSTIVPRRARPTTLSWREPSTGSSRGRSEMRCGRGASRRPRRLLDDASGRARPAGRDRSRRRCGRARRSGHVARHVPGHRRLRGCRSTKPPPSPPRSTATYGRGRRPAECARPRRWACGARPRRSSWRRRGRRSPPATWTRPPTPPTSALSIWTTAAEVGQGRLVSIVAICLAFLVALALVAMSLRGRRHRRREAVYAASMSPAGQPADGPPDRPVQAAVVRYTRRHSGRAAQRRGPRCERHGSWIGLMGLRRPRPSARDPVRGLGGRLLRARGEHPAPGRARPGRHDGGLHPPGRPSCAASMRRRTCSATCSPRPTRRRPSSRR